MSLLESFEWFELLTVIMKTKEAQPTDYPCSDKICLTFITTTTKGIIVIYYHRVTLVTV